MVLCLMAAAPRISRAVDTVETWDVGATDVDFYTAYDGLGLNRDQRTLASEITLGYGLIERLSAYLGAALNTDEAFTTGTGEVFLGLFGTPIDSEHIDLDFFLDFRLGGEGFSEFQIAPAVELNFDLAPDLQLWGMFINMSVPIYSQSFTNAENEEVEQTATHVETIIGTYITIARRHQLLLDFQMALRPMAPNGEQQVEIGSLGIGYNVFVCDSIELISEVRLDIPQDDEELSVGFILGLIATVPSRAPSRVEPATLSQAPRQRERTLANAPIGNPTPSL